MKTVFIADAHLRDKADTDMIGLSSFIDDLKDTERLVIMGDLFDFWIGGNNVAEEEYAPLIESLRRLKKRGVEIIYLEGNHDFHMGSLFTGELGAKVFHEGYTMQLGPHRTYLAHGDTIRMTTGYLIWRSLLRSPIFTFLDMVLPSQTVWDIAKRLSKRSRGYGREKPGIERAQRAFAKRLIKDGYDAVVLGHSHVAGVESGIVEGMTGIYANPGGWINKKTFLVFEDGNFRVEEYKG